MRGKDNGKCACVWMGCKIRHKMHRSNGDRVRRGELAGLLISMVEFEASVHEQVFSLYVILTCLCRKLILCIRLIWTVVDALHWQLVTDRVLCVVYLLTICAIVRDGEGQ